MNFGISSVSANCPKMWSICIKTKFSNTKKKLCLKFALEIETVETSFQPYSNLMKSRILLYGLIQQIIAFMLSITTFKAIHNSSLKTS